MMQRVGRLEEVADRTFCDWSTSFPWICMLSEFLKHGVGSQCSDMPGMLLECAVSNAYGIEPIKRASKNMSTALLYSLCGKCKAFKTISKCLKNFIKKIQPSFLGFGPICPTSFGVSHEHAHRVVPISRWAMACYLSLPENVERPKLYRSV